MRGNDKIDVRGPYDREQFGRSVGSVRTTISAGGGGILHLNHMQIVTSRPVKWPTQEPTGEGPLYDVRFYLQVTDVDIDQNHSYDKAIEVSITNKEPGDLIVILSSLSEQFDQLAKAVRMHALIGDVNSNDDDTDLSAGEHVIDLLADERGKVEAGAPSLEDGRR